MPGTNPWLKKKNLSRQRNVKARTRWLGGRAGLPKSSEDSSNVLFGVLTSGIPVLSQGPMASSPYIVRGLLRGCTSQAPLLLMFSFFLRWTLILMLDPLLQWHQKTTLALWKCHQVPKGKPLVQHDPLRTLSERNCFFELGSQESFQDFSGKRHWESDLNIKESHGAQWKE